MITAEVVTVTVEEIDVRLTTEELPGVSLSTVDVEADVDDVDATCEYAFPDVTLETGEISVDVEEIIVYYVPRGVNR